MTPSLARSLPELDEVLPISTEATTYRRKGIIYAGGSLGIFYVHSGIVRVFRSTEEGESVHVDFYRSGQFFGFSCLEGRDHTERAVAHCSAVVSCWPTETIARRFAENPQIAQALLRSTIEQSQRTFARLLRMERLLVAARLQEALVDIAMRIGETTDGLTFTVEPAVTHEVLAQSIGTKRELATLHMNRLRESGFVDFSRRQLVIRVGLLRGALARKAAA